MVEHYYASLFYQLKIKQVTKYLNIRLYNTKDIYIIWCLLKQRRQWHPTPVLLHGKSHGGRSLVGCSPWGHEESDTTEQLHFHFSFSCTGEGNGNPLQCSCLENPRDGGAWWAAVYGVAQSQTWLKRLSSSSSNYWKTFFFFCKRDWEERGKKFTLQRKVIVGKKLLVF